MSCIVYVRMVHCVSVPSRCYAILLLCCRTWKNAQLGERIIVQMEHKSKDLSEEMNKTIQKLNDEASALIEEKEKKAVSCCHHFSTLSISIPRQLLSSPLVIYSLSPLCDVLLG